MSYPNTNHPVCMHLYVPDFPWRVGFSYLSCRRSNEGTQRVDINTGPDSVTELEAGSSGSGNRGVDNPDCTRL